MSTSVMGADCSAFVRLFQSAISTSARLTSRSCFGPVDEVLPRSVDNNVDKMLIKIAFLRESEPLYKRVSRARVVGNLDVLGAVDYLSLNLRRTVLSGRFNSLRRTDITRTLPSLLVWVTDFFDFGFCMSVPIYLV